MYKYLDKEFTTKEERDSFQSGFQECLKKIQEVKDNKVALENFIYVYL